MTSCTGLAIALGVGARLGIDDVTAAPHGIYVLMWVCNDPQRGAVTSSMPETGLADTNARQASAMLTPFAATAF
ncbi:hypothetical protein GCM10011402_38240 [Paracoccus acridae]|uniref:Uncharacterized protein n=1 Tax=Paracoccus acridae TaxID=1795310 RepID=A0ABQ1VMP6_9RHOB|nr:hypothetical protein GCM10011402_38240 [Paracoccus acridae]